jgi:hypothetical protein
MSYHETLMARTPMPRLERAVADWLRREIKAGLEHRNLRRTDLCDAGNPIDERTIFRYLSPKASLAKFAAFELILRCKRLGIRLHDDLVRDVYGEMLPAIIVFNGEAKFLAVKMAYIAATELRLSCRDEKRLVRAYVDLLEPYEYFNMLALGKEIFDKVKSYFGGDDKWDQRFMSIRHPIRLNVQGDRFEVLDPTKLIEQAMRRAGR